MDMATQQLKPATHSKAVACVGDKPKEACACTAVPEATGASTCNGGLRRSKGAKASMHSAHTTPTPI